MRVTRPSVRRYDMCLLGQAARVGGGGKRSSCAPGRQTNQVVVTDPAPLPPDHPDAEIVAALRGGDVDRFDDLVRDLTPGLTRMARMYVDDSLAGDVVQSDPQGNRGVPPCGLSDRLPPAASAAPRPSSW
jgi:hypothetical protein